MKTINKKIDVGTIWEIGDKTSWNKVLRDYSQGDILRFGVNYCIIDEMSEKEAKVYGRYGGYCFGNALMKMKIEREGDKTKNFSILLAENQGGEILEDEKEIERINYCYENKLEATA